MGLGYCSFAFSAPLYNLKIGVAYCWMGNDRDFVGHVYCKLWTCVCAIIGVLDISGCLLLYCLVSAFKMKTIGRSATVHACSPLQWRRS